MDLATVAGLLLCFGAITGSIAVNGDFDAFFDIPAIIVVTFGVVGSTFIRWPLEVLKDLVSTITRNSVSGPVDLKGAIEEIGELAEMARRESIFSLEKVVTQDSFLKKAITLAADNRPTEAITSILNLEINTAQERHRLNNEVFSGIANDGPAFGMIGTLIGLVMMLGNLTDQAAIGPAMAVAILTTFYGAIIGNIFGNPFRSKLEKRAREETVRMNIILQGVLGIVAGENPRLIKERLTSFLPPSERLVEAYEAADHAES